VTATSRTVLLLSLLALLTHAGHSSCQGVAPADGPAAPRPGFLDEKSLKIDQKDDELRRLLKSRCQAAVDEFKARFRSFTDGRRRTRSMRRPAGW
jgi:hypothetical protein